MKIFIVGLGLMGGAYALKLTQKGHTVSGYDTHLENWTFNLKEKRIDTQSLQTLNESDVVILALPFHACLTFVKAHVEALKKVTLVTDIAGIKWPLVKEITQLLPDNYISHHPMTGKESTGPEDSSLIEFAGKNVIIIHHQAHPQAEALLNKILEDLRFAHPTIMSAKDHDDAIAFTSHLPHVLAACLIHQSRLEDFKKAAGNSFFEMTRFAGMNTDLWSDLLTANKGSLYATLESFIDTLQTFKNHLNSQEDLKEFLKTSLDRYQKIKG